MTRLATTVVLVECAIGVSREVAFPLENALRRL